MARVDTTLAWGNGMLLQSFPAAPWRGKRLVFSAAMRAEAPRIGTGAQLVVNVWPKRSEGANDTAMRSILALQSDGPVRSPDWTRRSIAVDIPANAERVQIGLVTTGCSTGWFGDLELETAGSALVSHREHNLPEVPVRTHHRERLGHLLEWKGLINR